MSESSNNNPKKPAPRDDSKAAKQGAQKDESADVGEMTFAELMKMEAAADTDKDKSNKKGSAGKDGGEGKK